MIWLLKLRKGVNFLLQPSDFSIYAFQELKKELQGIDELRFIFTSPTFTTEKAKKEKWEFYIPRLNRERSLYGTEFEIKLRNELTQKAIAKECVEWMPNWLTYHTKLMETDWKPKDDLSIELKGLNMDAVWENIIVQIGGITIDQGNTLDEQIAVDEQRIKIQKEIDRLTKAAKNEKQPKKKFELAQRINKLKQELEV